MWVSCTQLLCAPMKKSLIIPACVHLRGKLHKCVQNIRDIVPSFGLYDKVTSLYVKNGSAVTFLTPGVGLSVLSPEAHSVSGSIIASGNVFCVLPIIPCGARHYYYLLRNEILLSASVLNSNSFKHIFSVQDFMFYPQRFSIQPFMYQRLCFGLRK